MPNDSPVEGKCNASVKNGEGYCANPEGFRCDRDDTNRCFLHGGDSVGQEGHVNAETHGLYTDRQSYYKHRSDKEKQWMDAVTKSLMEDAPFDETDFAKYQMVRNIAIDMHKLRRANDYIEEKGVVHKDKTVGYTDDGKPLKQDEENPLNIAYDRLNKTVTKQLKELNILDSPDSKQAEADQNIAEELARLRAERDT